MRRKVNAIVVAVPPSVLEQWKSELEERFGLVFELLDRAYFSRLRRERGFGVNPWRTHSRFLVSHNLLVDPAYADPLREWLGPMRPGSLLILDEAHHAAPSSGGRYGIETKLTRAVRDVGGRFEHRLFLSATPHNGHSNSFSTLLELLDPYRLTRGVRERGRKELDDVMVRRLKEDVRQLQDGSRGGRSSASRSPACPTMRPSWCCRACSTNTARRANTATAARRAELAPPPVCSWSACRSACVIDRGGRAQPGGAPGVGGAAVAGDGVEVGLLPSTCSAGRGAWARAAAAELSRGRRGRHPAARRRELPHERIPGGCPNSDATPGAKRHPSGCPGIEAPANRDSRQTTAGMIADGLQTLAQLDPVRRSRFEHANEQPENAMTIDEFARRQRP